MNEELLIECKKCQGTIFRIYGILPENSGRGIVVCAKCFGAIELRENIAIVKKKVKK